MGALIMWQFIAPHHSEQRGRLIVSAGRKLECAPGYRRGDQVDATQEVFPVRIALRGREIWLAWVAAESGNYFVQDQDAIVWSPTRAGLLGELSRTGCGRARQDDTLLDLDSAVGTLRDGRFVDADRLVELWNILSDFYNTVHMPRVALFSPEDVATYDALFANSDIGNALELEPVALGEHHLQAVLKVMERGSAMIAGRTFGA